MSQDGFFGRNKHLFDVALYIYAGVYPLLLFLTLELLNPVSSGILWQIGAIAVSAVMIFLLALFFYSFIGNVFVSYVIVTLILLFAYTVNYFKIMITGGIFVPSDLRLAGSAITMIGRDAVVLERNFILWVLIVMFMLAPLYFCRFKSDFRKRISAFPAAIAMFLFVHLLVGASDLTDGRTFNRYRDSGFILGFYTEMAGRGTNDFLDIPPNEISERFALPVRHNNSPQPVNPNVIVIMSESFFDPTVLPNISFSQNPVANFHRLAKGSLSGSMVVPVVGGGTSNTEFEFLGGSPHVFFGSRWYVPFVHFGRYFYRDINTTLPWMFRQNGYRTVAVHTFWGYFFNRNRIYHRIGFDDFVSIEYMPDAVYKGDFVSDEYFTDRIIEQIILAEEAGEPLFLFGISMQNHWPFHESRYGNMELDVLSASPYLNNDELSTMNTFLQGIFDADRQLGRLVDFVESRETPTIVVFFGDHLPIMGINDHQIFEKLGFLSVQREWDWSLQDIQNAFKSHYLVWANFEHGLDSLGTVSTFLLGAFVAEASGIRLNRYFSYLLGAAGSFRVLTRELFLPVGGEMDYGYRNRQNTEVQILESLWHHKMFGRSGFSQSLSELLPRY